MMTDPADLPAILEDLRSAREDLEAAQKQKRNAEAWEMRALNRLNDVQKAFDAAVAHTRKEPMNGSDWANAARPFINGVSEVS